MFPGLKCVIGVIGRILVDNVKWVSPEELRTMYPPPPRYPPVAKRLSRKVYSSMVCYGTGILLWVKMPGHWMARVVSVFEIYGDDDAK